MTVYLLACGGAGAYLHLCSGKGNTGLPGFGSPGSFASEGEAVPSCSSL